MRLKRTKAPPPRAGSLSYLKWRPISNFRGIAPAAALSPLPSFFFILLSLGAGFSLLKALSLCLSFSLCFVLHHLISLRSRPGGLPRICTLIVRPMILSRMSRNNCPLSVLILCSHLFQVIHVHLEDHHSVRKRSIDQNLRIKLYYDESVYK